MPIAAALLLWLLNHPYQGIWHDARIYALLAAHWLAPDAFAPDLFFRFGSQGELSLFTPLYGGLVGGLGLDRAAWWVVLTGGIAWIAAVATLASAVLGRGAAAGVAVLLAAVLTVSYSPNAATFELTENFATARSWAVACGVGGVAALVAGRRAWAAILSLGALLLHPLLGIWPLALCVLVWLPARLATAAVLGTVALAAALGVANLDLPYLRVMRGDWLLFARDGAPDILFRPTASRLTECIALLVALVLGRAGGSAQYRSFYVRAALLGSGGLGLAVLASFWRPLEILVQAQPWRVCWLLWPLAMCALLDVSQRLARESHSGPLLLGAVAAMATLGTAWWLPLMCLAVLAALLPSDLRQRADSVLAQRRLPLTLAVGIVWLMALPGLFADWEIAGLNMLNPWWNGATWLHGLVAGGSWQVATLACAAAWWHQWMAARTLDRLAFAVGAVLLMAIAVAGIAVLMQWDRRTDARRVEEGCYLSRDCPAHPFQREIAIGETVFWPGRELTVWLTLNRASYYGEIQRTGAVFSQAKFAEWQRRDARVAASPAPAWLCADPALDWLVLGNTLNDAGRAITPRAEAKDGYLYSCADVRNGIPADAVAPAPTLPR